MIWLILLTLLLNLDNLLYTIDPNIVFLLYIILVTSLVIILLLFAIKKGYDYHWTGFGKCSVPKLKNREISPAKTLWDWLQLLIIPVMLAGIALIFTYVQSRNEQQTAESRAEREQYFAEGNQRENILQQYRDRMSELILGQYRFKKCKEFRLLSEPHALRPRKGFGMRLTFNNFEIFAAIRVHSRFQKGFLYSS